MDLFDMTGRAALVAGGAGYLGTAVCEALAKAGAAVMVADISQEKAAAGAEVARAGAPRARVESAAFDAADDESACALVGRTRAAFGRLDVLVNMTYKSIGKFAGDLSAEEFDLCNRVNVTGAFVIARAAAEAMERGGSIVLFSSMYGHVSPDPRVYELPIKPNPIEYGAGKAAVEQMVRYLAVHYAPRGIRVNGIAPGPFPAPANHGNVPFMERLAARVPLGRIGRQGEVAGGVVYLASEASSYVTGQILSIDGGWTAW